MTEINYAALERYILSVNGNRNLTHEEMMNVKMFCHGIVGLACEWMLGEIEEVYEQSIPEPLKKYLLVSERN